MRSFEDKSRYAGTEFCACHIFLTNTTVTTKGTKHWKNLKYLKVELINSSHGIWNPNESGMQGSVHCRQRQTCTWTLYHDDKRQQGDCRGKDFRTTPRQNTRNK
ncbi:hypothetical protein ACROYT_G032158 [Oculina patagonica]